MPGPLPNVNKVVRVTQIMTDAADNDVVGRTFMQYSGSAPSDGDLNTYAGVAATSWGTNLSHLANGDILLREILCEDLTSPTAAVGAFVTSLPGTRSGAAVTAGVATVLSFKIARRYRGGHPRTYWPGAVTTDVASGQTWQSTWLTALLTGYDAYIADLHGSAWGGSGTVIQVNVSYFSGYSNVTYPSGRVKAVPTPRITPLIDPVVAILANGNIASQRRRNLQL